MVDQYVAIDLKKKTARVTRRLPSYYGSLEELLTKLTHASEGLTDCTIDLDIERGYYDSVDAVLTLRGTRPATAEEIKWKRAEDDKYAKASRNNELDTLRRLLDKYPNVR